MGSPWTAAEKILRPAAGRLVVPRTATPQAVASELLGMEAFSSAAQRALERIASESDYAKRVRYLDPDTRVLVFPRAPNPDDSIAAIREVRAMNLAPEFLQYFPDDPIPRRMNVPFEETPLAISQGRSGYHVDRALAEQGRYQPRVLAGVLRGAIQGMPAWYGTQQLADLAGYRNAGEFAEGMAVATHGRDPVKNARAATHMLQVMRDPKFAEMAAGMDWSPSGSQASAAALKAAFPYPESVDSFASLNDFRAAAEHVLSKSDPAHKAILDIQGRGAGKRQFFGQNLSGNYDPYTGDRHEYAARGFPEKRSWNPQEEKWEWQKELGSTSQLEAMNILARQISGQTGLLPAEVQEMRWIGDAGLTGVKPYIDSTGQSGVLPSLIHGIEDRIRRLKGTDPSTESGLRRGRSLIKRAISGEILLPAVMAPAVMDDDGGQ